MKRFLIIDDEPAIGRFIQKIAEGCGYAVTVTEDPEDFMDQFMAHEPDVIAMDLSMPKADGVELLRFLGTCRCRSKILIISGFDPRVLETAAQMGAAIGLTVCGTLTKPMRAADVRASIQELEKECAQ